MKQEMKWMLLKIRYRLYYYRSLNKCNPSLKFDTDKKSIAK